MISPIEGGSAEVPRPHPLQTVLQAMATSVMTSIPPSWVTSLWIGPPLMLEVRDKVEVDRAEV
jgi:hypothetical protein